MKTSFCLSTTYIEKSIVKCEEPLFVVDSPTNWTFYRALSIKTSFFNHI